MFFRQLSFLPKNYPALIGANGPWWSVPGFPPWPPPHPHPHPPRQLFPYRTVHSQNFRPSHFAPAPRPWWSVRGFPPWPPYHPHPQPPCQFFPWTVHSQNFRPSHFATSCHSFHTSTAFMREHQDQEPPHKRRRSTEEMKSERERHRGGEPGMTQGEAKAGGSRREHGSPGASASKMPRKNHWCKDGSEDRRKTREGKRDHSRENSRGKDVERTRSGSRDVNGGSQRKASTSRGGTPDQRRSGHEKGEHKDSQPAGARGQGEQGAGSKPNPWFKQRGAVEEQGGTGTNTGGAQEKPETEGGPLAGFPPLPHSATHHHNSSPPASPGSSPPVRQLDRATPVRPLYRHWEASPACSTDLQPPGVRTSVFDFSVLSYNILSQDLLHDNAYLYRHCDPGFLHWDYRLPNLLAEIQNYNADILCLQEVQEDHYENQIKPALQALGYQCEFKKRTGRKPDGCAVIFKTSRLSLLSSNPIEFFRPSDVLLDRDNVGLVLLLKPNDATGQSDPSAFICVANTHLLYNPRRGDIKLAQLAILLAEIGRLSRLPDGSTSPVVLCGDFNSTPWSPLYTFLTTGCLEYKGLPIGMVSGQENSPRGQRLLTVPIWSQRLGINQKCQYENQSTKESSASTATEVEGAISNLTVEDLATKAAAALHRAQIEHSLKLQSTYQHHLSHDGRPEITTCHSRTAITVDYILYTPDSITSSSLPGGWGLQLLGRLSLVGHSELMEVDGLPNRHQSSDHLPLLARFRLRH